jgi:hypothetical protein
VKERPVGFRIAGKGVEQVVERVGQSDVVMTDDACNMYFKIIQVPGAGDLETKKRRVRRVLRKLRITGGEDGNVKMPTRIWEENYTVWRIGLGECWSMRFEYN